MSLSGRPSRNPSWNVPTPLVRADIVPKAIRDGSYFQQHGYTLLSDWSKDAKVIDTAMIDWNSVSALNFTYRVRQAPGASNSLGHFKFNMPRVQTPSICTIRRTTIYSKRICVHSARLRAGEQSR